MLHPTIGFYGIIILGRLLDVGRVHEALQHEGSMHVLDLVIQFCPKDRRISQQRYSAI